MSGKPPVLGIDFGTTNTAAAWVDEQGELQLVPVQEGEVYTLPSVVFVPTSGQPVVGRMAVEKLADEPERTYFGLKRFLGRRHNSEFVTRGKNRFPFDLLEGHDGLVWTRVDGIEVSLASIARHVMVRIVELANAAAGFTFQQCVLTVPAHFTHRQREVIRDIAQQVLEVKHVVNEPTAAAVAYSHAMGKNIDFTELLVYDLGGGTFDTTLMRTNQSLVEVLATGGDAFLGGADFDARIVDMLVEHLEHKHEVDVRNDAVVMQRLTLAAERAKITLSDAESADVRVPLVARKGEGFVDLHVRLHRRDVERVCAPLIERTLGICEELMERSEIGDIDAFVFVGGQTKMPAIRNRLEARFPQTDTRIDPETAVAAGAAWIGSGVRALLDVVSVPIAVVVGGGAPVEALPRHTPVPATRRVPVRDRPAAGAPLIIAAYQALDLTSVERDLLGVATIDAAWLRDNDGELILEVRMTSSFELKVMLHSRRGARLPVELKVPRQPRRSPSGGLRKPKPMALTPSRSFDRPARVATLGIKDEGGIIRWYQADELNDVSGFLGTCNPFPAGSPLEIGLMLPGRPARFPGTAANPPPGRTGMSVTFEVADELKDTFHTFLAERKMLDRSPALDADRLTQFIRGVEARNAYSALSLPPEAVPAQIREAVGDIRGVLARETGRSPASLTARFERLEATLDNTAKVLLGGYSRLVHDFKLGRVNAEVRLRQSTPKQVEVMRQAWRKVHPELAVQSSSEMQTARKAAAAGSVDEAIGGLEKALEHDPFNADARRLLLELRAS
jgi:molecular chaperone DnaK